MKCMKKLLKIFQLMLQYLQQLLLILKLKKLKKKIKKENLNKLEIEKNKDILDYTSKHNKLRPKLVIGFAAETNNLEENFKKN